MLLHILFEALLDSVTDHAASLASESDVISPENHDALIEHAMTAHDVFDADFGKCKIIPPLTGPKTVVGRASHSACKFVTLPRSASVTLKGF